MKVECGNCGRESLECEDDDVTLYQENAASHIKHRVYCTWGCGSFILAAVEHEDCECKEGGQE